MSVMTMSICINPGSEPINEAVEEHAKANIKVLCADVRKRGNVVGYRRNKREDDGGRFGFILKVDGIDHDVEMPGWPLDEVRYVGGDDQNIWDFPRLYVDGSSWVWKYAVDVLAESQPLLDT